MLLTDDNWSGVPKETKHACKRFIIVYVWLKRGSTTPAAQALLLHRKSNRGQQVFRLQGGMKYCSDNRRVDGCEAKTCSLSSNKCSMLPSWSRNHINSPNMFKVVLFLQIWCNAMCFALQLLQFHSFLWLMLIQCCAPFSIFLTHWLWIHCYQSLSLFCFVYG